MQFFQFLQEFELLSQEHFGDTKISPREVVEYYLQKHLPKNNPDVVLARVFVNGKKDGIHQKLTMDLIDYQRDGFTSMARTTAFPISIIGQMITQRGVIPGESFVPHQIFKDELSKRAIKFETKIEEY